MKHKYVSISAIIIGIALGCALHAEEERTLRVVPNSTTGDIKPASPSDGAAGLETAPLSTTIKPASADADSGLRTAPLSSTAIPGKAEAVLQTDIRMTLEHKRNLDDRSWQLFLEQGKEWDGFRGIDPRLHEIVRRLSVAQEIFLRKNLQYEDRKTDCYSGVSNAAANAGSGLFTIIEQRSYGCIASDSVQACVDRYISACTSYSYQARTEEKVRLLNVLDELKRFLQTSYRDKNEARR